MSEGKRCGTCDAWTMCRSAEGLCINCGDDKGVWRRAHWEPCDNWAKTPEDLQVAALKAKVAEMEAWQAKAREMLKGLESGVEVRTAADDIYCTEECPVCHVGTRILGFTCHDSGCALAALLEGVKTDDSRPV